MKKYVISLASVLFFYLFFSPLSVFALECNYKVVGNSDLGQDQHAGKIECESKVSSFLGIKSKSVNCYFTQEGATKSKSLDILQGGNVDKTVGFNSWDYIFDDNKCPNYLVFVEKASSIIFANTQDQIEKASGYFLNNLGSVNYTIGSETSVTDEYLQDKYCVNYKEVLDQYVSSYESEKAKYTGFNCAEFKTTDEEKTGAQLLETREWYSNCDTPVGSAITFANSGLKALDDYVDKKCLTKNSTEYKQYQEKFNTYLSETKKIKENMDTEFSHMTQEELDQYKEEKDKENSNVDLNGLNSGIGCEGIFGTTDANGNFTKESFGWLIQTALNYIKIIGPVLVIILSMLEFIKAIATSDEDAMKKAQSRLVVRLIAVVVLFLLPFLVGEVLKLINGLSNPTCGFK